MAASRVQVEVEGRRLSLSNLDKVLYPGPGFTKGQVIDYYTRVAPYLLAHLRDRPLTMKRYPDGVEGKFFYEKQCPSHAPEWVRTAPMHLSSKTVDFVVADDLATLVWAANLADLELHPSLSKAPDLERPAALAFDLDPGPPAGLVECSKVAVLLREALGHVGLEAFPKTSGSKGMQVYAPLNTGAVTYGDTKPFAQALARHLESEHPDLVLSRMKKELRKGKVFIDWSQNDEHKTTVCVYSLRAKERPTVSTPLTWEEVEQASSPGDLTFEAPAVLERCAEHGDLFAPVAELEQELPKL